MSRSPAFLAIVMLGFLFVSACKPEGDGQFEVVESRYFSTYTEHLGAPHSYTTNAGSHPARITVGPGFSVNPGADGRWNLDLWLTFKGAGHTTSLGGRFNCVRRAEKRVRCESTQDSESLRRGPSKTTVDFEDDRIASVVITELAPPSPERVAVEEGTRKNDWPKVVGRFRDRHYSWNDRRFDTIRREARQSVADEDSKPAMVGAPAVSGARPNPSAVSAPPAR